MLSAGRLRGDFEYDQIPIANASTHCPDNTENVPPDNGPQPHDYLS